MIEIIRMELPNVYGMGTVNSYLVKGSVNTLIDCGEDTDESWSRLNIQLQEAGLSIDQIGRLIITHAHVDHIGMAQRVAEASNCEIWMSDKVYPWATQLPLLWNQRVEIMKRSMSLFLSPDIGNGLLDMFHSMSQQVMKQWGIIDKSRIKVFDHDGSSVMIGDVMWEVIYAPGHSNTQSCFYNKSTQQLFSADMLLKITPTPVMEVASIDPWIREKSIITMLDSYEKFKNMSISMVYPGHYEEFDDPMVKIDHQVNRIYQRKEECYDLIKSGISDLVLIFQKMYKGRWHFPAFNMTLAYIDLLEAENKIKLVHNDKGPIHIVPVES